MRVWGEGIGKWDRTAQRDLGAGAGILLGAIRTAALPIGGRNAPSTAADIQIFNGSPSGI